MHRFLGLLSLVLLSFTLIQAEWVVVNSPSPAKSSVVVVESDPSRTTLKYSISGFNYREISIQGKEYLKISSPGLSTTLQKGLPELPKFYESIIIGNTYDVQVRVISLVCDTLSIGEVAPSKGNLLRSQDPEKIPYTFDKFYQTGGIFPQNLVELSSPFIVRDFRGITVRFHPFRYDATNKKLIVVKKAVIEVVEDKNSSTNPKLVVRNHITPSFKTLYANFFLNFRELTELYDFIEEPGKVLVICYDDFLTAAQPLVDWKIERGLPTELIPLSTIGSSSTDIQNFLQNEYDSEDPFTYVILVGDYLQVPCLYGLMENAPTDGRYTLLEGDDWYADAFISRISAQTSEEVTNQVYKFVQYEKVPFTGTEGEWYRHGTGIASNESGGTGMYDWERCDLLRDALLGYTYDLVDQIYDPGATSQEVIDAVSAGRSILNYIGHGSGTSWGTSNFNTSHVSQLTNGLKQPFILDVSCLNGRFTMSYDCLAEAWLKGGDTTNPRGAIAMFSSSTSCAWVPPTIMQAEAVDLLVTEQKNTFGGLCAHGVMEVLDEYSGTEGYYIFEQYNLFGDCSMQIRTDIPQTISASLPPIIPIGTESIEVSTDEENLLVGIIDEDNQLLGSGLTDAAGNATIILNQPPLEPGFLRVTITGYNKIPLQNDIPVIIPEGPWLLLDSLNIIELNGNNNSEIEYGETVALLPFLKNVGVDSALNVTATLSSQEIYVNLLDSTIIYPDIDSAGIAEPIDTLSLQISPNIPNNYHLNFTLNVNCNDTLQFLSNFNFRVNAPELQIINVTINDPDQSGLIDPGETGEIIVTIQNSGNAPVSDLTVYVSEEDPYINLSSGIFNIDFLSDHGDTVSNYSQPIVLTASGITPLGHESSLNLQFTTPGGLQKTLLLPLRIGHTQVLIWDKDGNHNSGPAIYELVSGSLGLTADYVDTSLPVVELPYYRAVFICLGTYPDKYVLNQFEAEPLVDYLEQGGNIYMEGGDTWYYDPVTTLHNYFGINAASDGFSDLSTIRGVEGSFLDSLTFDYAGDNQYTDRLIPAGNAQPLMENAFPHYFCAIYNQTENYRTIGASFELGGISDGQGLNTREYLLYKIFQFFDMGTELNTLCYEWDKGDVNHDLEINIMDIVKMVRIVLEIDSVDTCMKWAADVNCDSSVNIQDIVEEVNIVLNLNGLRLSRITGTPATSANLQLDNPWLTLKSDGNIQGLQLEISLSEVYDQENLISIPEKMGGFSFYQSLKNNHLQVLLFSLDGLPLPLDQPLLKINAPFSNVQVTAINTLGDPVSARFIQIPLSFNLQQNYPNPFNPTTTIRYSIPEETEVQLLIYNLLGERIVTLVSKEQKPGHYTLLWDGKDQNGKIVPSGIYFCYLKAGSYKAIKKMTFIR